MSLAMSWYLQQRDAEDNRKLQEKLKAIDEYDDSEDDGEETEDDNEEGLQEPKKRSIKVCLVSSLSPLCLYIVAHLICALAFI